MLSIEKLRLNCEFTVDLISDFIRDLLNLASQKNAIIAVSGGVDSSLITALCSRALGGEYVKTIFMPQRDITDERDITDVIQLTEQYDVTCDSVDITEIVSSYKESLPKYSSEHVLSAINIVPRVRMIVSYYYSNRYGGLVMGSSNKTELLTGYFTKYGDGGVDLLPIADLYKCQVRQLGRYLGLPQRILTKPPSAGLWPGQTDEGELGIDFDTLDLILYGRELGMSPGAVAEDLEIPLEKVSGFFKRVEVNEHKRRMPLILRLRNTQGI